MILLLLIHIAATLIMTGIIWFVQIVHYPFLPKLARGFAVCELVCGQIQKINLEKKFL